MSGRVSPYDWQSEWQGTLPLTSHGIGRGPDWSALQTLRLSRRVTSIPCISQRCSMKTLVNSPLRPRILLERRSAPPRFMYKVSYIPRLLQCNVWKFTESEIVYCYFSFSNVCKLVIHIFLLFLSWNQLLFFSIGNVSNIRGFQASISLSQFLRYYIWLCSCL